MSYATIADVEERLGSRAYVQLTDDAGTGVADEHRVAEALAGAEGEVDSYLGRRYAVPVDVSVQPGLASILKTITLDLVTYRLRIRRPPVPEDVRSQQRSALRWLEGVACGDVVLPSTTESPANPAAGPGGVVMGAPRVMSREELSGL